MLSTTRRQFEQWRQQHPHHKRLPPKLWEKALALARQHGINKIATVLGLNYDSLKLRLQVKTAKASPPSPTPGAFLELRPGPLAAPPRTCTIELDDGRGATLRIHLQGATMADLASFAAFWRKGPA
jgi:hypothetical protein